MSKETRVQRKSNLVPVLLVLTATTGIIDAVSYLGMGHVLVANMTGNVVFLGFVQNATARRLAVPDMTTTVLTMTLTGLAADSIPADGGNPRPWRRLASVAAMLASGAAGAALMLHSSAAASIGVFAAILAVAAAALAFTRTQPDNVPA
jgi:uncharacterized membrane protein YoaK (UPF0700 family)